MVFKLFSERYQKCINLKENLPPSPPPLIFSNLIAILYLFHIMLVYIGFNFSRIFYCFFKICMDVLPTGIYVYYMRAVPTEAIRYPGIEFIDRCEPPYGCWELN